MRTQNNARNEEDVYAEIKSLVPRTVLAIDKWPRPGPEQVLVQRGAQSIAEVLPVDDDE